MRWTIADEERGVEYLVQLLFEPEEPDEDYPQLPAFRLADLLVLEAHQLDSAGQVERRWHGARARQFDDRAWRVLKKDPALVEQLEFAAARPVTSSAIASPTAAETIKELGQTRKPPKPRTATG